MNSAKNLPPLRQTPVGINSAKDLGSSLRLRGLVGDSASGRIVRGEVEGPVEDAEPLGVRLAEQLLSQGAAELLEVTP